MVMSVFCKGCRKTKDNEEFGLKANGTQYKTCMTCRYNILGAKVSFISQKKKLLIAAMQKR